MLCDAAPVALTATGSPIWLPSTKNVSVPVGKQAGAAELQDAGLTVVVTVNGMEYCGEPVAGVVTTVVDVVVVSTAPTPLRAMNGAGETSTEAVVRAVSV